jgi:hypothetical protein
MFLSINRGSLLRPYIRRHSLRYIELGRIAYYPANYRRTSGCIVFCEGREYYGAGVGLPYTQYASAVPSKTNDLWIQGATNWTQYVITPVGTWLQLVAYAPVEGPAGFYEVTQTGTTSSNYKTYNFNQGYNTMNYKADKVGRNMLYFVVNSHPSNTVIVDVLPQAGSTKPVHAIS